MGKYLGRQSLLYFLFLSATLIFVVHVMDRSRLIALFAIYASALFDYALLPALVSASIFRLPAYPTA